MKESRLYIRAAGRLEFIVNLYLGGAKIGAEVGVWKGDFSQELFNLIPKVKLYLIDPWKNIPNYSTMSIKVSDECYEHMYQMVKALIDNRDVEILRMTSMEALPYVPDGSLDFVYIDANHKYDYVKADIKGWDKKVKLGGTVSGHDYDFGHMDVVRAVHEVCPSDVFYYEPAKIWAYVKK